MLAVLAVLPPALGDTTTFVDVNTCDGTVSLGASMDNDVLYNQVYNWMHQKKISNWTHKRVEATASLRAHFAVPENATLSCAEVSYLADMQLPDAFQSLLQHLGIASSVPITVRKTVCNTGTSIVEQAEVEVPVVNRVYIDAVHDVSEDCPACDSLVSSSTDVRLDVPWYARMLTRMITKHIGTSVGEKNRAVTASLCTARGRPGTAAKQHELPHAASREAAAQAPGRRGARASAAAVDAAPRGER